MGEIMLQFFGVGRILIAIFEGLLTGPAWALLQPRLHLFTRQGIRSDAVYPAPNEVQIALGIFNLLPTSVDQRQGIRKGLWRIEERLGLDNPDIIFEWIDASNKR